MRGNIVCIKHYCPADLRCACQWNCNSCWYILSKPGYAKNYASGMVLSLHHETSGERSTVEWSAHSIEQGGSNLDSEVRQSFIQISILSLSFGYSLTSLTKLQLSELQDGDKNSVYLMEKLLRGLNDITQDKELNQHLLQSICCLLSDERMKASYNSVKHLSLSFLSWTCSQISDLVGIFCFSFCILDLFSLKKTWENRRSRRIHLDCT